MIIDRTGAATGEAELEQGEGRPRPEVDLTPWPPDPRERRDFYHRIRAFPDDVARWREDLVDRLADGSSPFLGSKACPDRDATRALVDDGISFFREITRILAVLHGSAAQPHPGAATPAVPGPDAVRVLLRLVPYRSLAGNLTGMLAGQDSAQLACLVPPNLRSALFASLELLARSTCHETQPACEHCEIRNFCNGYRRAEADRSSREASFTAIDLFCGAGGLSEGFRRAGFHPLLALDQDAVALKTYWLNHPGLPDDGLVHGDVCDVSIRELRRRAGRSVDVLLAAPPCQGFSHVGFRSKPRPTGYRLHSDERNFLFEYLVQAAVELRPKLVVMENVPGMASARHDEAPGGENLSFLLAAARMLETRGGFQTAIWKVNASAYGVPQDRTRCFLVAARKQRPPEMPRGDYQSPSSRDFDPDALPAVTFDEAVFDLPPRSADSGTVVSRWEPVVEPSDVRYRRYLKKFRLLRGSRIIYNHTARYQNARDLELYALLKPGENSISVLERTGRHDLMRYRRDVFDDKYARLRADRPSKTIVAHLAKDGNGYIHPSQVRSITVREAARLQSFHDGYIFCGSPSDQWTHIGNAVPPLMAEAIAQACLRTLRRGTAR